MPRRYEDHDNVNELCILGYGYGKSILGQPSFTVPDFVDEQTGSHYSERRMSPATVNRAANHYVKLGSMACTWTSPAPSSGERPRLAFAITQAGAERLFSETVLRLTHFGDNLSDIFIVGTSIQAVISNEEFMPQIINQVVGRFAQ